MLMQVYSGFGNATGNKQGEEYRAPAQGILHNTDSQKERLPCILSRVSVVEACGSYCATLSQTLLQGLSSSGGREGVYFG